MTQELHAIIPAGGAGTRLWPLSRRSRPKFLLDPLGRGRTLLQETVDRLAPMSVSITIVTGAAHYEEVRRQLPDLQGEILVEPHPRDSMAAIGYAAYVIRQRWGDDAIIGSFAADHVIDDQQAFTWSIEKAMDGAAAGFLTTVGVTPTVPSPAFGYIHPGGAPLIPDVYPVVRFVEKPDVDTARHHVDDGFLWNAGIFVVKAGVLAQHLAAQLPEMDRGLHAIAADHVACSVSPMQVDPDAWGRLTKIAIDFALAEPVAAKGQVAVVKSPATLGWSDVGDFEAVQRLRHVTGGDDVLIDSSGATVLRQGTDELMVAILGLPGVVVVQTEDAVLVADAARAQDVKNVVDQLAAEGRTGLL